MITFMMIIALLLTVISYISAMEGSFLQEYGVELHTFATPFFVLGIVYEEFEADGYPVSVLKLGFIFVNLTLRTFKCTSEAPTELPVFTWESWALKSWNTIVSRVQKIGQ